MHEQARHFYEFGPYRLDANKLRLEREGEIVSLTPKTVETLLLLIQNRERVLERDELMRAVWADSYVEDGNLSVTISMLRKALGERAGGSGYIKTIPRLGYRFVADVTEREERIEPLVIERFSVSRTVIEEETPRSAARLLSTAGSQRSRHFAAVTTAIVVVASVAIGIWVYRYSVQAKPPVIRSIAVLPMRSFSGEDEELRLRLTDAVITRLGNSSELSVRPTNAVMAFIADESDPVEIGRSLQTDAVLSGHVQTEGDVLRVTLQLISVPDGKQIWSGQFDGQADQTLMLQDAIAVSLSQKLGHKVDSPSTTSSEAYEAYLKGRFFWNKRTGEGFARAADYFREAVRIDPLFAEAYVGIADAELGFYDYGLKPSSETVPAVLTNLDRALTLQPDLPEAHSTRGYVQFLYDHNWPQAELSLRRAISLNPNDAAAHNRYGWALTIQGRFDDALAELDAAHRLDPLSAVINTNIGYLYFCSRDYPRAETAFKSVIETVPEYTLATWYLGGVYVQKGDLIGGYREYRKAAIADGDNELADFFESVSDPKTENSALKAWVAKWEERHSREYFPAYNVALINAYLKDADRTLYWLELSYDQRDPWFVQVRNEPEFDFLKDDPRFQDLISHINL